MPKCDWWEQQTLLLWSRWLGRNGISRHLRRWLLLLFFSLPDKNRNLHKLMNQSNRVRATRFRNQLPTRSVCLSFPCLSRKKKVKVVILRSIYSTVCHFCVVWQSSIQYKVVRSIKNEMNSRPQIVYLFERYIYKSERKS